MTRADTSACSVEFRGPQSVSKQPAASSVSVGAAVGVEPVEHVSKSYTSAALKIGHAHWRLHVVEWGSSDHQSQLLTCA